MHCNGNCSFVLFSPFFQQCYSYGILQKLESEKVDTLCPLSMFCIIPLPKHCKQWDGRAMQSSSNCRLQRIIKMNCSWPSPFHRNQNIHPFGIFVSSSVSLLCPLLSIKFKTLVLQNLCGTEPHPVSRDISQLPIGNCIKVADTVNIHTCCIIKVRFRAKKYKINEKFFTLADFK